MATKKKVGTLKDLKTRAKKAGGKKQSKTKENKKVEFKQVSRNEKLLEVEKKNKTGIKVRMGRPLKYKSTFPNEMLDYFNDIIKDGYYDEVIVEEFVGKFGELKKKIVQRPKPTPTFEGFALTISVDSHTLLDRATKRGKDGKLLYPDFSSSYRRCLNIQKKMLMELGMIGQYNSNIAKFLLSANHNLFEERLDQKETETGKKKAEVNDTPIEDILQAFYD